MSVNRIALTILTVASLAGCGEGLPTEAGATGAESRSGKGTGMVTAVDPAAGTVTIEHEAMPELGWPAMTMAFAADPALLAAIAEGDKVAFDVTVTGSRGEITAVRAE